MSHEKKKDKNNLTLFIVWILSWGLPPWRSSCRQSRSFPIFFFQPKNNFLCHSVSELRQLNPIYYNNASVLQAPITPEEIPEEPEITEEEEADTPPDQPEEDPPEPETEESGEAAEAEEEAEGGEEEKEEEEKEEAGEEEEEEAKEEEEEE